MKYAIVRYSQKSHCDYPSPFFEEYIKTSDEKFDEVIQKMSKGCEDFDVTIITKKQYDSNQEYMEKIYGDEISKYRPLTKEEEIAVKFAYWNY